MFDASLIQNNSATCGEDLDDKEQAMVESSAIKVDDVSEVIHRERSITTTLQDMSGVSDPHLIIDRYKSTYLRGRPLDISDEFAEIKGKTFEIFVSRDTLLEDALTELSRDDDVSVPLDVTFIEEQALDLGGPRREFLGMSVKSIKERFLTDGRLLMEEEFGKEVYLKYKQKKFFETAGLLVGLSLLQGGPIPALFKEPENLFFKPTTNIETLFVKGLERLGLIKLGSVKKQLLTLFDVSYKPEDLTYPRLVKLLVPTFSEEGSNKHQAEKAVYRIFLDYLKEVAAKRRGSVTLEGILKFVTGSEEIPVLGYNFNPTVYFNNIKIPTSSTCLCKLYLPDSTFETKEKVFDLFDLAFVNDYFGLV